MGGYLTLSGVLFGHYEVSGKRCVRRSLPDQAERTGVMRILEIFGKCRAALGAVFGGRGDGSGKKAEEDDRVMYIIAGLGNPSKEYERTRHNVGFDALDVLADKVGTTIE